MNAPRLAVLLLVLGAAPAAAGGGGRPGGVFEFAAAGRGAGMGSAYTALADDVSSVYYNPAGLGLVRGNQLALMHSSLYGGATLDYLAFARQGRFGGLGAQLLQLGVGGLQGRDELNNQTGGFEYSERAISIAYGTRRFLDGRLALGLSAKTLRRSLGPASNALYGLDAGAQFNPQWLDRRIRLGLSAQNVVGFKSGDTDDKLPIGVKLGAGVELFRSLTLGLDVSSVGDFELGTEYAFGPAALRVGLREAQPTFGAGVQFRERWFLDLALANHAALGMTNQVSVGYRFGQVRQETKARGSYDDASRRAQKALDSRRYLEAAVLFDKALQSTLAESDPQRAKDRVAFGRLRNLVAAMGLESAPAVAKELENDGEQGRTGYEAVRALMAGEERRALLLAQAAHGSDHTAIAFRFLMDAVARLTFQKPAPDEILPRKALVEVKLTKARDAFMAGRTDQAAEECREVLMLQPDSALAHERLGSAYFALGLRDKAVLSWREALRLEPGNAALKDFMRRIKETTP